jgi:hypothetical protein
MKSLNVTAYRIYVCGELYTVSDSLFGRIYLTLMYLLGKELNSCGKDELNQLLYLTSDLCFVKSSV